MFIKNKTKVACRMNGEELSVLESCLLRPIMRNSVLEELRVGRLANNPGGNLLQSS